LKERFRCTLTDLSPEMLALSQAQNPECPHLLGDMRTLRLGQTFDVVFAHDAICYMASREDLRRVAETAYVHLRPGGAAIFAPDSVREGFHEWTALHQNDDGQRSLRCMEWTWDPDAEDETCVTDFAFLLREDGAVRSVHDRHVFGLFDTSTWRSILEGVGFRAETVKRASLDTSEPYTDQIFVGLK
jgi:SAM-dependent methyltransferase